MTDLLETWKQAKKRRETINRVYWLPTSPLVAAGDALAAEVRRLGEELDEARSTSVAYKELEAEVERLAENNEQLKEAYGRKHNTITAALGHATAAQEHLEREDPDAALVEVYETVRLLLFEPESTAALSEGPQT